MTLRFGILTVSDRSSRGEREDTSGPALVRLVQEQGWSVDRQALLPDDRPPSVTCSPPGPTAATWT